MFALVFRHGQAVVYDVDCYILLINLSRSARYNDFSTLTTRRFAELSKTVLEENISETEAQERMGAEFRTPGHIPVCRESSGGLDTRQGHTELAVGLARLANLVPVVIGAEMLQPEGDGALSVSDARLWAKERNIPFLEGAEVIAAFHEQSQKADASA